MEYTTLNNGVIMPMLGYGTWDIRGDEAYRCVCDALEVGYRLIDGAQYYANETEVGKAIECSRIDRMDIFLTTKLQSGKDVDGAISRSLDALRTDYLDLLLIHWPMGNDLEIWRKMEDWYHRGVLRAIGISNFYGEDFEMIVRNASVPPAVIQQEMHCFCQRKDLRPVYKSYSIQLEAWSPLADGRNGIFQNPVICSIAKKHNVSAAQVMLRFIIQCGVVAIPKSRNRQRMAENFDIFNFTLDDEDMAKMGSLDCGKTIFGWYE